MTTPPLKPTVRIAVAFALGQKYVAFAVQLALTVILARLLTPQETGIFSLAAAAVSVGNLMREFGTSDYIISQKEVSLQKLRAAFTVTVASAWAIAVVLWLMAQPMSRMYGEPGVARVLQVLCLNFLLLPFGSMAFAMLSKEMQFGRIFTVQTSATLVSAAATIWTAWAGYSYMSLAIGSVVANAWSIGMLVVQRHGNVFLRPTTKGLGEVFSFGGTVTMARIIDTLASRSYDFILGATMGFHATGLLSKVHSLIGSFHEYFNSAILRVATPAFAKEDREAGETAERYFQATVLVASAHWLFFPMLGIFAREIILILFGQNWIECAPVLQVSAIGAMMWAPFMLAAALLTAKGAVSEQLRIQFISAPLLVVAILLGSQFDLVTLAILVNMTQPVRLYMLSRALRARCGIHFGETLRRLRSTIWVGSAGIACGLLARWALVSVGTPAFVTLSLGGALMVAGSLAAASSLNHPLFAEAMRLKRRFLERA